MTILDSDTKLVKENDTIVLEDNWTNIKILIGGEQNMIFH